MVRVMFGKKFRQIGLKIAYYRKRKALKQMEVAERAGISCSYLSKIETGKVRYSLAVLMQIARALEIDPAGCCGLKQETKIKRCKKVEEPNYKVIGINIKIRRIRQGISQACMAKNLGVSAAHLW